MNTFREWLTETVVATTGLFRTAYDDDAPKNLCVEWARMQTLVFDGLGVKARAVPCDVMVGNLLAEPQLLNNTPMTKAAELAGAWTVGVHHAQRGAGSGWDGHLVTVVSQPGGGRILVDGTADQFNRPLRDIEVPAVVMLDLPAVWAGPVFTHPARHSGIIRYTPMPPQAAAAKVWRESSAWNNPVLVELADMVCSRLSAWVDVA